MSAERIQQGGYWQHTAPLKCPKGTKMKWMGWSYWLCGKACCKTIYYLKDPRHG